MKAATKRIHVFAPHRDPISLSLWPASAGFFSKRRAERFCFFQFLEGDVCFHSEKPGLYKVSALHGEEKSDPVEFCMTDLIFTMDKESYKSGELMKISFHNSAGDPIIAWQFNRCASEYGCEDGFFTGSLLGHTIDLTCHDVEKKVELYLMARNAYGVYTSERIVVN